MPTSGKLRKKDVVYKAEIRTPNQEEGEGHTYLGLASGLVKLRISNHYRSFNNPALRSGCELAKFVWQLKDKGITDFHIKWEILAKEFLFSRSTGKCFLCLREKFEIMKHMKNLGSKLINKREELFRKCLHRYKHCLGSVNTLRNNTEEQAENQDTNIPSDQQQDHNFDSTRGPERPILHGSTRSGRQFRDLERPP